MKRRDIVIIVLAMVVVAVGAVLINHYAFSQKAAISTPTTNPIPQAYRACLADGTTISTAMSAFAAQNPGVTVTKSDLVGNAFRGPYIQSWAYNPSFYIFSLKNGTLYLRAPNSASTPIKFTGPSSCIEIGL